MQKINDCPGILISVLRKREMMPQPLRELIDGHIDSCQKCTERHLQVCISAQLDPYQNVAVRPSALHRS